MLGCDSEQSEDAGPRTRGDRGIAPADAASIKDGAPFLDTGRPRDAAPPGRCCELGERACVDDQAYVVCGEGSAACWQFSEPFGCERGSACSEGSCRPSADAAPPDLARPPAPQDAGPRPRGDMGRVPGVDAGGPCEDERCVFGVQRCAVGATYETCGIGPQGCLAWLTLACGGFDDCERDPGACFGACEDVCELGETMCAQGNRYRSCQQGFDGCLSWQERFCLGGGDCADAPALCFGECDNLCFEGEARCADADNFQVCRLDEGCPGWQVEPCLNGANCFNGRGACLGECENACEEDARECTANGWRQCWRGFEGCTEWLDRGCFGNASCEDSPGACFGECFNECELEAQRCIAPNLWQRCRMSAEGCTEWEELPCAPDTDCFRDFEACAQP